MSAVLETTKMKMNLVRALRKTIGLFDREAALRERERRRAAHEVAAVEREAQLAAAHAAVEEWRSPELRLRRLQGEAWQAAQVESFAVAALEADLRNNEPSSVRELRAYVARVYGDLNRGYAASNLRPLGEALVAATIFCRDEGWRLPDDEARRQCTHLRNGIENALVKGGRDEEERA